MSSEESRVEHVDVLIPTCDRPAALAVTLTGLLGQSYTNFRIIVSDQSKESSALSAHEVRAAVRVHTAQKRRVITVRHLPRYGMAEQRQYLLSMAEAPLVLFLDDDVILEREVLERLISVIEEEHCGFVGAGPISLSCLNEYREEEQKVELWDGAVKPEMIKSGSEQWNRHKLHNAANLQHLKNRLINDSTRLLKYKVAWVGGCVLYDRAKLLSIGAFNFWRDLPPRHWGEDILVQLRLMARYGGCAVLPSGAYHQELPTTLSDRQINASEVLPLFGPAKVQALEPGGRKSKRNSGDGPYDDTGEQRQ